MIDLGNKRILLLGYGIEGRASFEFIRSNYPSAVIDICDSSEAVLIENDVRSQARNIILGNSWLSALGETDFIIRSPGIPPRLIQGLIQDLGREISISSATDIFLRKHRNKTIGVTGTKGKSTTASIISFVLSSLGYKCGLVGNIGLPALIEIDNSPDYFIYELSSYQLQDIGHSPFISVFLNIFPEHLDHHLNFRNYLDAKSQIFKFQNRSDLLVISEDLMSRVEEAEMQVLSEKLIYDAKNSFFWIEGDSIFRRSEDGSSEKVFNIKDSQLRGLGNLKNVLAVLCLFEKMQLSNDLVVDAIKNFKPLPHRLEVLGDHKHLTFVNDSISTVPEATINALDAFSGRISALIAGGFDRGVDYATLAKEILASNIELLLLFRPSGERINSAIEIESERSSQKSPEIIFVENMKEAVSTALSESSRSGYCLLSPASPSFNQYRNFQERGDDFRNIVRMIS